MNIALVFIKEVIRREGVGRDILNADEGIRKVYTTTGAYDYVAEVTLKDLPQTVRHILGVEGIHSTTTCIVLETHEKPTEREERT